MPDIEASYRVAISLQEAQILTLLRAFEAIQEQMHFAKIRQHKQTLLDQVGDIFPSLNAELETLTPPPQLEQFHRQWRQALGHLEDAYTSFLTGSEHNFLIAYFQSRHAFSEARYTLYALRVDTPVLQPYWVLPEVLPRLKELEPLSPVGEAKTGVLHRPATDAHAEYSLYVPEQYDPGRRWPLIIAMHGGHGRGDEYLHTWLRPAKSKGYFVLSPKSLDDTWSIQRPTTDIRSILSIVEALLDEYEIDTSHMFATGLSDGGTFSYALGLHCPKLFAGIAPIAGVLPGWFDRTQAKTLPIFIIHGAQDFIFPVENARMIYNVLTTKCDFTNVTYKELPDWGHAYTYSINETLVLPWFESLPPNAATLQ